MVLTARRWRFVTLYLAGAFASLLLLIFLGQDFFPSIKSGEIDLHMRAPIGTRIEEAGKISVLVQQQISDLEPLQTEMFQLNYQKAEDVRKLLVDEKQRMISKRGSVVVDPRTNQLFVQDTSAQLEEVRRLISRIDIPVPQVLIEARIVEADDEFSRDIGARLGFAHPGPHAWINSGQGSSFGPLPPGTTTCPTGASITCIGNTEITNLNFVNLPAASLNGFSPQCHQRSGASLLSSSGRKRYTFSPNPASAMNASASRCRAADTATKGGRLLGSPR